MKQRAKTSKIWLIQHEVLQNILDNSNNYVEVLTKLGYDGYNGNHRTLKDRLLKESFDLTKIEQNKISFLKNHIKKLGEQTKIKLEDILVENSSCSRKTLKKRLIEEKIKEYKCECCGIGDIWNGKKLSLQLDHKNGINNDNRPENIRFICPNCHSQTPTFSGKNRENNINNMCIGCGIKISNNSKRCDKCETKNRVGKNTKFNVTKDELEKLINEMSFIRIGKMFDVSDNAIRKRCKRLGIQIPKRPVGYWLKK